MLTDIRNKEKVQNQPSAKGVNRWLWIPIFLLVLFIGDRAGGFVLKKIESGSKFRFTKLYNGAAACDILIAGNSRGLSFYQPFIEEKTNQKVFSLAYNGMSSSLLKVFIQDYFERYAPPKKLILEVTCADRFNKELIPAFSTYASYSPNIRKYLKKENPNTYYGTQLSHLLRYNSEVFQRSLRYLSFSDKFWLTDRTISEAMQAESETLKKVSIDHIPELQDALGDIVKLAQSKGTKVELVIAPFLPNYKKAMFNLTDYIVEVERQTGLKVKNYSGSIKEAKYFGDYFHINVFGSEKFINFLDKDGVFN